MTWIAKMFGTLIVEIDFDGTLSIYYRLWEKDYEVPYTTNDKKSYTI